MISVRRNVFETNSSSTHSISIIKLQKPKVVLIPRNLDTTYKVEEYGDVGSSDERFMVDTHSNEVDKLRFVINMIATIVDSEAEIEWECEKRRDKKYTKECFEKLINHNLFIWLKDVVKENTGTEIEYVQPDYNWFPFFETTYSEDDDLKTLLHLEKTENGYDETKFKNRIKEIIFDNEMIIENENCPYGMERY